LEERFICTEKVKRSKLLYSKGKESGREEMERKLQGRDRGKKEVGRKESRRIGSLQ